MIDHTLTLQKAIDHLTPLDLLLRNQFGVDIAGSNIENGLVHVHFLVSDTGGDAIATAIINGADTLTVEATQMQIVADAVSAATITVAGLSSFQYAIFEMTSDQFGNRHIGALLRQGNAPDGSLVFRTNLIGRYLILVKDGNDSGTIEIEAISA